MFSKIIISCPTSTSTSCPTSSESIFRVLHSMFLCFLFPRALLSWSHSFLFLLPSLCSLSFSISVSLFSLSRLSSSSISPFSSSPPSFSPLPVLEARWRACYRAVTQTCVRILSSEGRLAEARTAAMTRWEEQSVADLGFLNGGGSGSSQRVPADVTRDWCWGIGDTPPPTTTTNPLLNGGVF